MNAIRGRIIFVAYLTFIFAAAVPAMGRAQEPEGPPPVKVTGRAEVSAGHLDTHNYQGQIRAALEAFTLGAGGGYNDTGGYRVNDGSETWKAQSWVEYRIKTNLVLIPAFDYERTRAGEPGFKDARTPRAESDYETYTGSIKLRRKEVTAALDYQEKSFKDIDPDQGLDARLRTRTFGPEVTGRWSPDREADFDWGVGSEFAEIDVAGRGLDRESRAWAYVTEVIEPADAPLRFTLGVRGDYYSEFAGAVSPEAAVRFGNNLFYLEAAFDRAYTAPSRERRYHRTSWSRPDRGLDPERSNNFRFTIYSDAYDSPTASLGFFYREIEDALVFARTPGPAGTYRNAGRATAAGLEFSFAWRPAEELRVDLDYTYEEARDQDRDRWLPARPRHRAELQLVWDPVEDLTVTAESSYVSPQFTFADNSREVADYYLTDLAVEYKIKEVVLTGRVDNLFNRPYDYGLGSEGRPLTWSAGLRYEW